MLIIILFIGSCITNINGYLIHTSFKNIHLFKSTFNNYDHVNSRINKMYSNVPTRNEDEWDEEDYTNMMNEIYPDEPTFAKMFPLSRKNIKPEMLRNRPDFSLLKPNDP